MLYLLSKLSKPNVRYGGIILPARETLPCTVTKPVTIQMGVGGGVVGIYSLKESNLRSGQDSKRVCDFPMLND